VGCYTEPTWENKGAQWVKAGCWEQGWGNKPTSQSEDIVDCWANLVGVRVVYKTEFPHFAGGAADQPEWQQ
jgi:hypothetical protein